MYSSPSLADRTQSIQLCRCTMRSPKQGVATIPGAQHVEEKYPDTNLPFCLCKERIWQVFLTSYLSVQALSPLLPPGRKIPPRGKHCCNLFWFLVKCKSLVFFHWKFFSDAFFQTCLEGKFAFPLLACDSPRCQSARRNVGFDTGEWVILQEMSSPGAPYPVNSCSISATLNEGKKEHKGLEEQAMIWSWACSQHWMKHVLAIPAQSRWLQLVLFSAPRNTFSPEMAQEGNKL